MYECVCVCVGVCVHVCVCVFVCVCVPMYVCVLKLVVLYLFIHKCLTFELTMVQQQAAPEPPAPVVKGPVPSEHKVLQDVFDSLLNACSQRAANAVSLGFVFLHFGQYTAGCEVCVLDFFSRL